MNDLSRIIIFVLLILVASILYSFANFKEDAVKGKINIISQKFLILLVIALSFGSLEYLFKIPGFILVKDLLSPVQLQMIWLFATSISVILFQRLYLNQIIQRHSYITFSLIFIILIIEMYMKSK